MECIQYPQDLGAGGGGHVGKRGQLGSIHLIHIPKTGGTALRAALEGSALRDQCVFHGHLTTVEDIPPGDRFFFCLRHPIARFVSGFNSRLRRGRPRYDFPWTAVQEQGFNRFRSPNELAESLSSKDDRDRHLANCLMRDILIVAVPLSYWLRSVEYLSARRRDLLAILRQECLEDDFQDFRVSLGLDASVTLPTDAVSAHRAAADAETKLSSLGYANLTAWYAAEIRFYEEMLELRARFLHSFA